MGRPTKYPELQAKTCKFCGVPFMGHYPSHTKIRDYCSISCGLKARHERQGRYAVKHCCVCGKDFRVSKYREMTAKFCSRDCANKGKIIKRNSGSFQKGLVPWNKGLKGYTTSIKGKTYEEIYGEEKALAIKNDMSTRRKGQGIGENNPFFGKHHTEKTKGGNAKAHMGKKPWNKGLSAHEDSRVAQGVRSMVAINKNRLPEHNAKLGACHARVPSWNKGISPSEKTRQKLSKSVTLKIAQDPEYREQVLLALEKARKAIHRRPNAQEQTLAKLIEGNKLPFKYTGDGSFVIGGYIPDFVNYNGKKQTIELFGDYWHNRDGTPWHQTELGRMMAYCQFGYKTLIIWEHELKKPEEVIRRIKQFTKK